MFAIRVLDQLKSNCDAYNKCYEILDKWTLERSPIRVKNREACRGVMKVGEFEDRSGAEEVIMSMRDSIQVMTFGKEELYTKSKIEWIDDCTYKAIFIESTNPFESSILKKGDEREIRILDIKNSGEIVLEVGMYGRYFLSKVYKLK
jgi:hypothetical protein